MAGTSGLRAGARGVLGLFGALMLLLSVALPAWAEPDYPPVFYKISADSYTTHRGGEIGFTAQTFAPGSAVTFKVTVDGASAGSASTTANSKGIASRAITFQTAGANTVTVSGTSDENAQLQMSTNVSVVAATSGGSGTNGSGSNGPGTTGSGTNNSGTNGSGSTGSTSNGNDGSGNSAANNGGSNSNDGSHGSAAEPDSAPFFAGGLPRTGTDVALTVLVALALVAGGTVLVLAGRRRRTDLSD